MWLTYERSARKCWDRALAPGGKLLISVSLSLPDTRRSRLSKADSPPESASYSPVGRSEKVTEFGGIGSSMALMMNSWIDNVLCFTVLRRLVKGLIFPASVCPSTIP